MRTPRGFTVVAVLAALLGAGLGPPSAPACCQPTPAAVAAACGGCCPQASVCAPRAADEATTGRAFSCEAPALAAAGASASRDDRLAGHLLTVPRRLATVTPPHLSHIPLLV
jgi:hypothetical protein